MQYTNHLKFKLISLHSVSEHFFVCLNDSKLSFVLEPFLKKCDYYNKVFWFLDLALMGFHMNEN